MPGGFGVRGVEGMVDAIQHAREHAVPFFGICLGMQTAIIEFARNVCGLDDSHSSEFAPECDNPVISLMESQQHVTDMGGTMRLGAYPCRLARGSRAAEVYGVAEVSERHRHRYEVSNKYRDTFVEHGMLLSGLSPDGQLVEIVELPDHPWFVGCQFHPELQSRPTRPHPLFAGFIAAAAATKPANSGCGRVGRDWSSGWNWQPMNHGCCASSTISTSEPSGDSPLSFIPPATKRSRKLFDTS